MLGCLGLGGSRRNFALYCNRLISNFVSALNLRYLDVLLPRCGRFSDGSVSVTLVLLFAVSSATASFVEASPSNLCQAFFSFFTSFRETVCFPFFWATLTPSISCAKPVSVKIRCLPATEAMVKTHRSCQILPFRHPQSRHPNHQARCKCLPHSPLLTSCIW